jgi:hypothetical protein
MMQAMRKATGVSNVSSETMYGRLTGDKLDEDPKPHPLGVQIGHLVCVELLKSASNNTAAKDCDGNIRNEPGGSAKEMRTLHKMINAKHMTILLSASE